MTILEAIKARHSVRQYTVRPLEAAAIAQLEQEIRECNVERDLHIQLVAGEPEAFSGAMAHYGKFTGVRNYIALVGKKRRGLEEDLGYCGQRIALKAQMLGLNTCWVAMSFSKKKSRAEIAPGEKLVCVIALGYGVNSGIAHKNREMETLYRAYEPLPGWFRKGMEAALLAPTAMNQQRFRFTLTEPNLVKAESTGGFYSQIDLGIVKYHFEIGAGKENFRWLG